MAYNNVTFNFMVIFNLYTLGNMYILNTHNYNLIYSGLKY